MTDSAQVFHISTRACSARREPLTLSDTAEKRAQEVIVQYPHKRSAVMPLLYIAQEQTTYMTQQAVDWVAAKLEPLLAANLFAMGVGGAVIGVDAQARVFLTQHFQEDGLEFAVLLRWLERFVQRAVACRASLAAPSQAGAT